MTEPTGQPQDATPAPTPDTWEREKLSRRAALRKFGFGAGMAAVLALSSDDLARMASGRLKQMAGDNQVANAIADEFKNAGVAFATPSSCVRNATSLATCKTCCTGDFGECESNIPVRHRYPVQGVDCKTNMGHTACFEYRRRYTACQDQRGACQEACERKVWPTPQ